MAFDNLSEQSPIFPPEAERYSSRAIELSHMAADKCDVIFDVAYGNHEYQKLDIYRPRIGGNQLPILLFAHGGGWTHGYKEWLGLLAPAITDIPAIFVSVSYRLAPQHRHPAGSDDCIAALRWTCDNIDAYGGDPRRLFTGGHSAGGHLYALATLRRDLLQTAGIPPYAIRACFPVSARFNLVNINPEPGTSEHRINTLLLAKLSDAPAASPVRFVDGNQVPFLLTYGTRDFPNIIRSNREMAEALRDSGSRVEELVLPGDHFDTALDTRHAQNPWTKKVRAWMNGQT